MQTWAKRGIKTALVTGGLLMLGTGIASADENVSPDSPAGPLDVNLNLPVQIEKNALGTPAGQVNLPGYTGEISTKPVTKPLKGVTDPLQKAAAPASKATAPLAGVTDKATSAVSSAAGKTGASRTAQDVSGLDIEQTDDVFKGNKVDLDVTAPIQICGNAIGVIGDAVVEDANCTQSYSNNEDTTTDGKHSGLAGNVVALDWALPIQIAGNAGGVAGGSGYASGTAEQEVTETGDISTDGTGSGGSGNVVAPQFATPVQVTGNAASWILGNAYSEFDAETEAESGGWIQTNGDGGAATGNVVGVPIALPVKFNGNAAGAWGSDADSVSHSEADATAGDTTPGLNDIPAYITTEGDKAFLAGTVVQPQGALVANVAGNAASWIGNATTGNAQGEYAGAGSSSSEVEAGGFSSTTGQDGAGTGNIVDLPVAVPVEAFGIGGTYIGNAHAAHDNETSATAGEGTYTTGDGSFLSANTVTGQPALTGEVFGIGGSHIGNASGTATETKTVQSGGYNGSTGNDSSGSGNIVQVPLAVPAEVFGIGGSYIGQGEGTASETKEITAGGGGNTDDDNGFGSSNLVASPLAIPAQVFGIGASHIGRGTGEATTDTQVTAGDDVKATGNEAGASGNIGFVPVALPVQAHGLGASFIGTGFGTSENLTDAVAGGDATTGGEDGAVAGNIVQAPFAGAATLFGSSAGLAALVGGDTAENDVVAEAGGDSVTNGDGGGLAGNVVSAQGLPIAQVFGNAVAAAAKATGSASNTTDATSGGDITTSGVDGAFSGNILDVPAAAVAQVFGNAVAAAGVADATADNVTSGKVGGDTTTAGTMDSLSGFDGQVPVGVVAQIFDVPLALLGVANAEATNATDIMVDNQEPQFNPIIDGSELPLDAVPSLNWPSLPSVPGVPTGLGRDGDAGLPTGGLPTDGLPTPGLPSLPGLPGLPGAAQRADAPLPSAPGVPDLGTVTDLPSTGTLPIELSGLDLASGNVLGGGGLPTDALLGGGLPVDPTNGVLPADAVLGGGLPVDPATTVPMDPQELLPTADVPAIEEAGGPLNIFQKFLSIFSGK
ncbi:beta strand repeat-containing protein [Amycolatopsis albispora]|uniref:PE-PGRS family protein n=1 Tax=Amycolatopsis albispora TaxID=1804986 RepID=A0A344LE12_9PSEU|nr:chaplin family protein [Amycolatopsis albispora]AXB46286.1 PE-PGRS family protein [Amycolatopsis albispora]